MWHLLSISIWFCNSFSDAIRSVSSRPLLLWDHLCVDNVCSSRCKHTILSSRRCACSVLLDVYDHKFTRYCRYALQHKLFSALYRNILQKVKNVVLCRIETKYMYETLKLYSMWHWKRQYIYVTKNTKVLWNIMFFIWWIIYWIMKTFIIENVTLKLAWTYT